ncbi:hypothetical protein OF83DRAFT_1062411, partial [Amylostereum chailletii]
EEVRGPDRGSYIWGRSVHNIRIEHLWVDVMARFGAKWKVFFRDLELHHALDVNLDAHIWLLHHLFLPAINMDIQAWSGIWNNHTVARRGQCHLTPSQMYQRGILAHGHRALFNLALTPPDDPPTLSEEEAGYGVDWPERNGQYVHASEADECPNRTTNPFDTHVPEHMSHIEVPDARCPLTADQISLLTAYIQTIPYIYALDMRSRAQVWDLALQYCRTLITGV